MTDEKRLEEILREFDWLFPIMRPLGGGRQGRASELKKKVLTYIESLEAKLETEVEHVGDLYEKIESLKEERDEAIKERKDAKSLADFQLEDSEAQLDSAERFIQAVESEGLHKIRGIWKWYRYYRRKYPHPENREAHPESRDASGSTEGEG